MNWGLDHNYVKYYKFSEGDIILDLGATVGEFGLIHRHEIIQRNIHLISVEPDVVSYSTMLKNYKHYGLTNITNFNTGVWKEDTELVFTQTDNPWCNMFDIHGHDVSSIAGHHTKKTYKVLSLDTIMQNFSHINFVKADIEGAELEVFMGCKRLQDINAFAIAAYHIRDGKETSETLAPFFISAGYNVKLDNTPFNDFPSYTMLYAERK